jgi:hypothetical protein
MTLIAHIYKIPPGHTLSDISVDCADLASSSRIPNPFYHPAILSAATKHLSTRSIKLIVIKDNGIPVAALPTQGWQCPPLYHQAFTHNYSFLHSPLYQNTEALRMCILESLKWSISGALLLPNISLSGGFHIDLREALKGSGCSLLYFNKYERAGYLASTSRDSVKLSSRHQKKLLKRLSHLGNDNITTEINVADYRVFAGHFLALEESGWKGRLGTALTSSNSGRNFFHSIFENESFKPHLLCSELSYKGTNLALSCTFAIGSSAFRFKTSYNEHYQQFSPGVVLEMAILKSLISKEYFIDGCCSPHAETMNRLYPHKLTMASALIFSGKGFRGKIIPSLILKACQTLSKKVDFALCNGR